MNLAPILLANMSGWRLPDYFYPILDRYYEVLEKMSSDEHLLQTKGVLSFADENPGIGLFKAEEEEWQTMTSSINRETSSARLPANLIRACFLDSGSVLVYPDDPGDEPNFTLFLPKRKSSNELALSRINFTDLLKSPDHKVVGSDGCVVCVTDRPDGSRYFSCSNEGCGNCTGPFPDKELKDGVVTIYCWCDD